jgi:hypothetical protein
MFKITLKIGQILDRRTQRLNKARKKFIRAFIFGLIEKGTVEFTELAKVLNDEVEASSNLRRIQMFFADYELNYLVFARIFMDFIPLRGLDISVDRTNWKFGKQNINILTLSVGYQGVGIPILYELLDKRGNSNQTERIDLMDKFIQLFGRKRIRSFSADREFIGEKWLTYLSKKEIPFYIRIRKNTLVNLGCSVYAAVDLFDLNPLKKYLFFNNVQIMGNKLNIALGKDKDLICPKDEIQDHLIIITNQKAEEAFNFYQKRWSIEVFFQSIKGRGFKIEKTHLTDLKRLKKLFTLVALAFCCCLIIGIHTHRHVKSIRRTCNGYKINSFFRVGKDKLERNIRLIYKDLSLVEKQIDIILTYIDKNRWLLNPD